MAITGPSSYAPTMQEFIAHWTAVNAFLTPGSLKLPDGFTIANFTTLRTTIIAENDAVQNKAAQAREARQALFDQKTMMKDTLEMFRQYVIGVMPFTAYAASLPTLPRFSDVETRFLNPSIQAAFIWGQINATPPDGFTPPLTLPDATVLADFNTMIAATRTAYNAVITAETAYSNAVRTRNADLPQAKLWMKQYRNAVLGHLLPGNSLRDDVPHYSPINSPTPKPVSNVLYYYNALTNAVRVVYAPSVSANIAEYELRFSPGAKYDPTNEITVATNPPTAPFEFDYTLDQVLPLETGLFKVYTINDTGNERASKLVKIKRAAEATGTPLKMAA